MSASFMHNVPLSGVKYLLQTHSHADHFDPAHLSTRIPEYAGSDIVKMHLLASAATINKMSEMLSGIGYVSDLFDINDQERLKLNVTAVKPMQSFILDPYQVTAFPTNHDKSVESLLFSIQEGEFTVFYGTDTDELPEETWEAFHAKKLRFNVVILDQTYGRDVRREGHLNAKELIRHIDRMRDEGLLATHYQVFATHISHEGNEPHEALSKYAVENGYKIAYDGLVVSS